MNPSTSWAQLEAVIQGIMRQFTSPSVSIFWGYLTSAAVLAALVFVLRHRSVRGLLAYVIPWRVWLSRSTFNDFALFVINTVIYSFWLLAPLSWISTTLAQRTWLGLHQSLGPMAEPLHGPLAMFGFSLVVFVVADLSFFLAHFALHRIPVLWEFHKVHHSAPVLQPLTVLRRHPVDIVLDGAVSGALLGPLYGVAGWLGGGALTPLTILGVNAILFVGLTAGFNLQHSHVWLSFGPLDKWLISPASHQLHHSTDPAHHDRNFGNFLAIWDRLAGSLLRPRELAGEPTLRFGLGEPGGAWEREYGSLWRLYLWPLWRAARLGAAWITRGSSLLLIALVQLGCDDPTPQSERADVSPPPRSAPSGWCGALPVEGVEDAISVSSEDSGATCAIVQPGRVWCWGTGSWDTAAEAVAPKPHHPILLQSLGDDVIDIVLGTKRTCSLHDDGEVRCWERGHQPKLLAVPPARQVALDATNTWVLTQDGRVIEVGVFETREVMFTRTPVHAILGVEPGFGESRTLAVIAGDEHRLVVDEPAAYLLGLETPLTQIDRVLFEDGFYRGCVVERERGFGCWQVGGLYPYLNTAPVHFKSEHRNVRDVLRVVHTPCFAYSDGRFACELDDELPHPRFDSIKSMTGSTRHGCVVRDDDRVWCWGYAEHGVLGYQGCGALP